jgi:hypothetical protein
LPKGNFWHSKLRTAAAAAQLCRAQLLVSWIPFNRWSHGLGYLPAGNPDPADASDASCLAADIEWAARRLPFPTKCLPRAIALSRMLRQKEIGHAVVIAVRPSQLRHSPDALHAWVEIHGQVILGYLPGPWIETMRLGESVSG